MRHSSIIFALPLVLLACTPAHGPGGSTSSSSMSSASVALSSVSSEALSRYEDPGIGYSIDVPSHWTTVENKDLNTDSYEAKGTAFVSPVESGTTLDEAYFHVAQIAACPKISGQQTTSTSVTIAGTAFERSTWDGAAAGNRYEGITYAGPKDAGCLVLTGFLHSCNLGPDCGANHSAPFNKDLYISTFDTMAKSVEFLAHPGD